MSSILTNSSAMNALATLKDVNRGLNDTQTRVSTGLKVSSGKDNAAYFAVSETMKGDSGMFKAINEGMTATKNSVATARLGAETVSDYTFNSPVNDANANFGKPISGCRKVRALWNGIMDAISPQNELHMVKVLREPKHDGSDGIVSWYRYCIDEATFVVQSNQSETCFKSRR